MPFLLKNGSNSNKVEKSHILPLTNAQLHSHHTTHLTKVYNLDGTVSPGCKGESPPLFAAEQ